MTDVKIDSGVVDVDQPLHVLLNPERPRPHLAAALEKWRRQVEDGTERTISAFGSSVR